MRGRMLLGVVEGNPLLRWVRAGAKAPTLAKVTPSALVGLQEQGGVVLALGQVEELLRHGLRRLVLPLG